MTPCDHASEAEKALAEVLRANGGGTACAAWIYNHGPALLAEVEALREGYERLRDASDSEMGDGDLAREIAAEMLRPNVRGKQP